MHAWSGIRDAGPHIRLSVHLDPAIEATSRGAEYAAGRLSSQVCLNSIIPAAKSAVAMVSPSYATISWLLVPSSIVKANLSPRATVSMRLAICIYSNSYEPRQ